jgi:hypothetical protein
LKTSLAFFLKHPLFKILPKRWMGKKPKKPFKTTEEIFNSENSL